MLVQALLPNINLTLLGWHYWMRIGWTHIAGSFSAKTPLESVGTPLTAAPGATWRCLSAEHSSGAEILGSKASYRVVSFLKPDIWKSGMYNITCGKDKVYASVLQKKSLRDGRARAPCRALSTTRHCTPFQVSQLFNRQIKIPCCIVTERKTKKKREIKKLCSLTGLLKEKQQRVK